MKLAFLVLASALGLAAQTCTMAVCTAATVAESDVLAALPTSGNTNPTVTVNIPAGSATWTTEINYTMPAGVTTLVIVGAGTPNTGTGTFGAGTSTTTITDNGGSTNPLIDIFLTYPQIAEIQQLNIVPLATNTTLISPIWWDGTCTSSGCPQVRLTNVTFGVSPLLWSVSGNGSQAGQMTRASNVFGVYDHNTIPSGSDAGFSNTNHGSYLGVGSYGDKSWASADSFGTANNLFFENNIVYSSGDEGQFADNEAGTSMGSVGGARVVARYNQAFQTGTGTNSGLFNFHGVDSGGRNRGGREAEVYHNTVTGTSGVASSTSLLGLRSGTALSYDNTMSATVSFNNYISPAVFRRFAAFSPWAGCGDGNYDSSISVIASGTASGGNGSTTLTDSSQSWTTNQWFSSGSVYSLYDSTANFVSEIVSNTATVITFTSGSPYQTNAVTNGDSYQIVRVAQCVDQPGRGAGVLLSGTTPSPTGSVAEILDPIYEWNDTLSSGSLNQGVVSPNNTSSIIANRDWYAESKNQASQTTASSPFGGTSGTGHGTLANRPTTCTTGVGYAEYASGSFVQLDICTGTNTWTDATYTPYTYPHPLDGGPTYTGSAFSGSISGKIQ